MPVGRTEDKTWNDLKKTLREKFAVISVEGPIGVGKTTLVRRFGKLLKLEAVEDSSLENPLLKEFYSQRERYAFPAQVWFAVHRRKLWDKVVEKSSLGSVVVDFMPLRERIFAGKIFREPEARVFNELYEQLFTGVKGPDAVIYLTADTDILMERIAKRGVSFEGKITRKYLQSVADEFHNFFLSMEGLPVLVVNTNDYDILENEASVRDILSQLLLTGSELQYYNPPTSGMEHK